VFSILQGLTSASQWVAPLCVVVYSGPHSGCGEMIALRHGDGSVSTYCHFSSRSVRRGVSVDAGQVIGRCGRTGAATGDHVHLGVRSLSGSYYEYFDRTSFPPGSTQLDPGGC
jgi:murein DD-endopeptidase MepM/ murein hydrolase activator NlpD